MHDGGGKGGADRVLGNGVVLEVSRLLAVLGLGSDVLAEEDLVLGDGRDVAKDLDLQREKSQLCFTSRNTSLHTFSSRMSSEEKETGRSMVRIERT